MVSKCNAQREMEFLIIYFSEVKENSYAAVKALFTIAEGYHTLGTA